MNALTNLEMINELRLKLDEAHNPGWSDWELARFINDGVYQWLSEKYSSAEADERLRSELSYLIKTQEEPIPVQATILKDALFVLSVELTYDFQCSGISAERTVIARPIKLDTDQLDPFAWGGSDYFPAYTTTTDKNIEDSVWVKNKRLNFISPGVPKKNVVYYISETDALIPIDDSEELSTDAEKATIMLPRLYQLEIIERAVKTIAGVVENSFRVQTQTQVEIPAKD